jgi:hypothetical protein
MTCTAKINLESTLPLHGQQALIASVGGIAYLADWKKPSTRPLSEFIGMSGLTFALSEGAVSDPSLRGLILRRGRPT